MRQSPHNKTLSPLFYLLLILSPSIMYASPHPDSLIKKAEVAFAIDPQLTIDYSKQVIELKSKISPSTKGRALFLTGAGYFTLGEYDSTKVYLSRFIKHDSTYIWHQLHPRSYSWLCHIEMQEDHWRKALDYAVIGEKFAEHIHDTVRMIDHKNYLGEIYRNFDPGNHKRPLTYQTEALKLAREYGHTLGMTYSYNFIGAIYADMDSFDLAIEYYSKTIKIATSIEDNFALGQAYHNLATVENNKGNSENSFRYNNKAIKYLREEADQVSYTEILAICFSEIANHHLEKGQISLAQNYADSALKCVDISPKYRSEIIKIQSQIKMKTGDFKEAFLLLQKYEILKDSLATINNNKHINNLLEWYDHEKSQKEIGELENLNQKIAIENSELTITSERSQHQRSILIWMLVGISTFVLFAVLWYLQKRKTRRAEDHIKELEFERQKTESYRLKKELDFRIKSMTSYSLVLAKQNEVMSKIKSKLRESNHDQATLLANEISISQAFENEWMEFNELFLQTHPNFKLKLKDIAPELTSNDTRICVLLKLEMTSKQIAQVIGVEPRTVDMARSRIRKKLAINKSDSLSNFIINLA